MKSLITIILIISVLASVGAEEPLTEVQRLQAKIKAVVPDGWRVAQSSDRMVITCSQVSFMNSIGLPAGMPSEQLWEEFSWKADYILILRFTPVIDQETYELLLVSRKKLRDAKESIAKKSEYGLHGREKLTIAEYIEAAIPLPLVSMKSCSIWISSNTKHGRLWVRPNEVKTTEQSILKLLRDNGENLKDT